MQAECPHLGADLSNAELIDMEDTKILLCPWHSYDFDLKTGESSTGLKSCIFPTRLEGNHLLVSFEKEYELVASRPVSEGRQPLRAHSTKLTVVCSLCKNGSN